MKDTAKRKAEKDARPKKKAKVIKDGGLELSDTVAQEGPSEPTLNVLPNFLPRLVHLPKSYDQRRFL